jgi:hypothetical protein
MGALVARCVIGISVRTQDIALSMACAINQYKGTDLLKLKILLEI